MGKARKFKQMRRLAAGMPEIKISKRVSELISGADVIKSGVNEINGKEVSANSNYKKVTTVPANLNHMRQMKKIYNKHKIAGVIGYVDAVNNHAKNPV